MPRNTVSNERIVTRPNSALGSAPSVFVIAALGCAALLLSFAGMGSWGLAIPVLMLIVILTMTINSYSKRVVFDRKANKVFSKSLLSSKTYETSDLHSVMKVDSTGSKDYYVLTTKSDPYGQGIQLTKRVAMNSRELDEFEANILPEIRMFLDQPSNTIFENQPVSVNSAELSTYRKTASDYYFYDPNLLLIILGAALFGLSVWWIYNFDVNNLRVFLQDFNRLTSLLKFLSPLLLFLSLIIFGRGVLRTRIDPQSDLAIKEYLFGAFKKNYKIKIPVECYIQSNRQNGRHTETDVRIAVTDGKADSIVLRHFYRTGKVEKFIAETRQILASNLPK